MSSAAEILAALNELGSFVEPLAAELLVVYRARDSFFADYDIVPGTPHWMIRSSTAPEAVVIEPTWVDSNISEVQELSVNSLLTWMRGALHQMSPSSEELEISWDCIDIRAVRARLPGDVRLIDGRFRLQTDRGPLDLAVEWRGDGLWVSGPVEPISDQPPLSFHLDIQVTLLTIHIHVHWSLWTVHGTPGYLALRQGVRRIIARGWKLADTSDLFAHDPI
jgi:hypothetical protein